MGATVTGMDAWLRDLRSLPERAPKAFRPVVSHAGLNIKQDWKANWEAISHHGHIRPMLHGIGYDMSETETSWRAEVGVDRANRQAPLAHLIERGTPTSRPHPAAVPALEAEAPRMARWAEKVAVDLLEKETSR